MKPPLGVVVAGFCVFWLLCGSLYTYVDAPYYGMDGTRWAAIVFFVPVFGFFTYLFEREERTPDDDREEMFTDGPFNIHRSRAEETPTVAESPETDQETDSEPSQSPETDRR